MNNIEKTIKFLQDEFDHSPYMKTNPNSKEYRLNHTYRVAAIGKEIATKENLNVDAVVIGCLLHDISYKDNLNTKEKRMNHGRSSASISRPFVETLNLSDSLKEQLLYGIAIHVDDKSDFECERTVLAETISDCDNIDRFDRYRLYENLKYSKLDEMTLDEQLNFVVSRIDKLKKLKDFKFNTKSGDKMWKEKIDFQILYYKSLLTQLKKSNYNNL